MLKDDRMMGMLTFVVIMLAVGTMIQRVDFFERLFGGEGPAAELNVDEATARAGEDANIDVLANDADVDADDAASLTIVAQPECGRASVREGRIHYRGDQRCVGAQTLRYGLGGDATAALRIAVEPAEGSGDRAAAEPDGSEAAGATASAQAEDPEDAEGSQGLGVSIQIGRLRTDEAETASEAVETGETGTGARSAGRETSGGAGAPTAPAASATGEDAAAGTSPEPSTAPGLAPSARAAAEPGAPAPTDTEPTGDSARDCTIPPTLTLDLAPGAMTEVSVDSSCHAGTVAELAYDGLRFAIPLGSRGAGSLEAPGFRRATEATLTLEDGETVSFSLSFRDIERIDRVAVAWQAPEGLALHAFEFGARPGSEGHVSPGAPRSFAAVRRRGGGWLASYEPAGGKGQRIEVYSFWRRYVGPSGVVKLGLDPGRPGGDCGGAEVAGADYEVLRSMAGQLERSRLGRIGALDCTRLAGGSGRFIGDAVDDLIVRRK